MTTYFEIDVVCGVCGKSSEHHVLGSTNTFGGSPDLDLRPPEMQRSTMGAWLQVCPHCGFCAPSLDEPAGDREVARSAEYQALLADERFPELARIFRARALLLDGSDPAQAAHTLLCAAWACDDDRKDAEAVECRELAIDALSRCKPFEEGESGLAQGAVLVDMLRRAGRFDRAASECEAMLRLPGASGIVEQVLRLQARLIAAEDREVHRLAEAVDDG